MLILRKLKLYLRWFLYRHSLMNYENHFMELNYNKVRPKWSSYEMVCVCGGGGSLKQNSWTPDLPRILAEKSVILPSPDHLKSPSLAFAGRYDWAHIAFGHQFRCELAIDACLLLIFLHKTDSFPENYRPTNKHCNRFQKIRYSSEKFQWKQMNPKHQKFWFVFKFIKFSNHFKCKFRTKKGKYSKIESH